MEPTGWFAVTATGAWSEHYRGLGLELFLADVSPVLAGGTCQAAEGGAAILERCNFPCP